MLQPLSSPDFRSLIFRNWSGGRRPMEGISMIMTWDGWPQGNSVAGWRSHVWFDGQSASLYQWCTSSCSIFPKWVGTKQKETFQPSTFRGRTIGFISDSIWHPSISGSKTTTVIAGSISSQGRLNKTDVLVCFQGLFSFRLHFARDVKEANDFHSETSNPCELVTIKVNRQFILSFKG